jgi:signal peptidase I
MAADLASVPAVRGRRAQPRARRRPRPGWGREVLLNVTAAGGVVCILLTIAALFFNVTLIMFKTGSMSPGIPAGSLAIVRALPATDISVGDIITVDRGDSLPVTHRVMSIDPVDETTVTVVLKGDANAVEDPAPYTISEARLLMASVPGLAYVVMAASNPLVMGGITLAAAGLVTWAFWKPVRRTKGENA